MNRTKRRICILGSTGSVGSNTLNVIREHTDRFDVVALSCGSSIEILCDQIAEFQPGFVSLGSEDKLEDLKKELGKRKLPCPLLFAGVEGHRHCVEKSQPDVVMASMTGTFGLKATLQAIEQNVSVLGIANKEILVMAGEFINAALEKSTTQLVPVDSEHSAIFQSLRGNNIKEVRHIILTASGGPFRELPASEFVNIKKEDALKHPNWVMGAKITVDSASMMNKGLEFIEAIRLFGLSREKIKILVHPQSIVHSMVEYQDRSFMAQLGISDMRIPISLALSYPERINLDLDEELDLARLSSLSFEEPDLEKFKCLKLAMEAERQGSVGPIVLNAANDVAVNLFLHDRISFVEIPNIIENALRQFESSKLENLDDVVELDATVKSWVATPYSQELVSEAVVV